MNLKNGLTNVSRRQIPLRVDIYSAFLSAIALLYQWGYDERFSAYVFGKRANRLMTTCSMTIAIFHLFRYARDSL